MKKRILAVLTGLVLSATVALAATPAAPVFSLGAKSTKIADGFIDDVNDNRLLVIDGNNVYAAFNGVNGEARIVRSTDAGLTWGVPALLSASGSQPRIAKAKDPLNAAKNLILATWADTDGMLYSFFDGTSWSAPTMAIPSISPVDAWTVSLFVAPNNAVHIFYNDGSDYIQHAVANTPRASFGAPVALPWSAWWNNYSIGFDSASNIYAAANDTDAAGMSHVTFHKNVAGTSTWSNVTVATDIWDNLSMAVYDTHNINIADKQYSAATSTEYIAVAVSTNGGKTWASKPVTPNKSVYGTYPSITVNSSKVISVVGHYGTWSASDRITINKSSDNGATWSANVSVAGSAHSGSVLDASGKVCIISSLYGATESDPNFFAGTATDWNQHRVIYFSREK